MTETKTPLLSIVIPTKKSRLDETARAAITSVLSIPTDEIRVVVHVDADADNPPLNVAAEFTDPRLTYIEYPHPIPMTENWERAMPYANATYVMYLGDDDAVLPEVLELARWADRNDIDNVLHTGKWIYYWPTYADQSRAGTFKMLDYTGKIEWPDIDKMRLANSFGPKMRKYSYQPEVYCALMRRSVVEAMHGVTGNYFGSIIPDLYFAFAVAPFVKKYVLIDYPFCLSGHSGKANASRFARKKMKEQEDQFASYPWYPTVPRSSDFITFYADSKCKAYVDSGQQELLKNIRLPDAYAGCILNSPRSAEKTRMLVRQFLGLHKTTPGKAIALVKLLMSIVLTVLERINLHMPYSLHVVQRSHNLVFKKQPLYNKKFASITEAVDFLRGYTATKPLTLPDCHGGRSAG